MKKSWMTWIIVVVVIAVGIIVFNYQSQKKNASLSEIFPDEETSPGDVEYEFVSPEEMIPAQPASTPAAAVTTRPKTATTTIAKTSQPTAQPNVSQPATTMATTISSQFPYSIQVGSFQEESKAQQLVDQLKKKQYQAFSLARNVKDKGTWYRVYIGQFETQSAAEVSLTNVKNDYQDGFVVLLPKN